MNMSFKYDDKKMQNMNPDFNSYIKCENMYTNRANPYYSEEPSNNIFIIMENGKHGIIHTTDMGKYIFNENRTVLLPLEYDDISCVAQRVNGNINVQWFKLYRNTKVGLYKVVFNNENDKTDSEMLLDCEFDQMHAHEI